MYWRGLVLVVEPKPTKRVSRRGLPEHPFTGMADEIKATTDTWAAESLALRGEVTTTNKHLGSIAQSLEVISNSLVVTGKFIRRFGPWAIAAGSAWVSASPAVIKALGAWIANAH